MMKDLLLSRIGTLACDTQRTPILDGVLRLAEVDNSKLEEVMSGSVHCVQTRFPLKIKFCFSDPRTIVELA